MGKSPREYIDLGCIYNIYRVNVSVLKLLSQTTLKDNKYNSSGKTNKRYKPVCIVKQT